MQLTLANDFMYSKYTDEARVIHSKIDNIETMTYDKTEEVIEEVFESILSRYQTGLNKSTRGSYFVLDYVDLFCNKLHKKNLKGCESYIDFPVSIKKR